MKTNLNKHSVKQAAYHQSIKSKRLKVLLIEDNSLAQKALLNQLTEMGCVAKLATSGEQALILYREGFDFIVTDIGLPNMDGIAVAHAIRCQEKEYFIPILALSTQARARTSECLSAGINAVADKSISSKTLKQLINKLIHLQ